MKNTENGRSMVEMLGVLAIIGVLSVAGIAGYTMAMNKYKANEIVSTASQVAVLTLANNSGAGAAYTSADAASVITMPNGISMCSTYNASNTPPVAVTYSGAAPAVQTVVGNTFTSNSSFSLSAGTCS